MSTNRLLPVVIPQGHSISLTSPYGSPKRMAEVHELINRIMYAGICMMIPEEAYLNGVTHKTILTELGVAKLHRHNAQIEEAALSKLRSGSYSGDVSFIDKLRKS